MTRLAEGSIFRCAILLVGVVSCSSSERQAASTGTEAGSAAASEETGAEDGGGCSAVGPYDASGFTVRASCAYGLPSEAGPRSACDEWWQGGPSDWDAFVERCLEQSGTVSAQPCASAGQTGRCEYAATCSDRIVTYVYGANADSFATTCLASAGATWAPE